jgi:hypothetical protein
VEANAGTRKSPWSYLPAVVFAVGIFLAAVRGGSYAIVPRSELFVMLWSVLGVGLAAGLLPRAAPPRAALAAAAALAGLAVWCAVGLVWTESAQRTVLEATRVAGFLGLLIVVLCVFGADTWRWAAGAVTASLGLVCALALASRLAPDLIASELDQRAFGRTRLAYPMNYWNGLGTWAAMTVACSLAWSAHAERWLARGAFLGITCMATTVAYLTYSRSAAAGVVFGAICVVVMSRHRWTVVVNAGLASAATAAVILSVRANAPIAEGTSGHGASQVALALALSLVLLVVSQRVCAARLDAVRLPARATRVVAASAVCLAVAAGLTLGPTVVAAARDSFRTAGEPLSTDPAARLTTLGGPRSSIWEIAVDAIALEPVTGVGAGTFEFISNRSPERVEYVRDAHSLYLESLVELGPLGVVLVVIALGGLLIAGVRGRMRQHDAMAAGAATGCVSALAVFVVTAAVDWMWELTAIPFAALTLGGLAAAASSGPAPRVRLGYRVVGAGLAIVVVALTLPPMLATMRLSESARAVVASQPEQALEAANGAVQAEPWGARGYLQRALVLERYGALREAALDARRAGDREPTNWQVWLVLSRIEAERGQVRASLAAVRRARRLNPRSTVFAESPAGPGNAAP